MLPEKRDRRILTLPDWGQAKNEKRVDKVWLGYYNKILW